MFAINGFRGQRGLGISLQLVLLLVIMGFVFTIMSTVYSEFSSNLTIETVDLDNLNGTLEETINREITTSVLHESLSTSDTSDEPISALGVGLFILAVVVVGGGVAILNLEKKDKKEGEEDE